LAPLLSCPEPKRLIVMESEAGWLPFASHPDNFDHASHFGSSGVVVELDGRDKNFPVSLWKFPRGLWT
jgi:hypothetical protein